MRSLLLFVLFLCLPLIAKSDTVSDWLNAAPKADVTFTPWDGDLPAVNGDRDGAPILPEGFYGYIDLSRISAVAFPIRLKVLYDIAVTNDIISGQPGVLAQLKGTAPVGTAPVIEEMSVSTPQDGHSVPIWNSPLTIKNDAVPDDRFRIESVRVEIQNCTGELIGRLSLGVSSPATGTPRVILVNNSEASRAFADANYQTISEVKRLVPNSYAYTNIETIWIDSATASDSALSDAFWQQILLGGTTIAGLPSDIEVLSKRLGIAQKEPAIRGALVAAESPSDFCHWHGPATQGESNISLEVAAEDNPFIFSIKIGQAMHRQLLRFSEFYLGIYVVLQAMVIVVAFFGLRGSRRVWLWLVVPGFALGYTVAGVILSHLLVRARSDERVAQVQIEREGWSDAVLLTHIDGITLAEKDIDVGLPTGSRPFIPNSAEYEYRVSDTKATFSFKHDFDAANLTIHASPAVHVGANVRSIISLETPLILAHDGRLSMTRAFSGAWLWDGSNWYNLGRVGEGMQIDWKTAKVIHPLASADRLFSTLVDNDDFPAFLKPILAADFLMPLSSAGEGIFLGVEPVNNVQIAKGPDDRLTSRRVVAYQFHLTGGPK